MKKAVVIGKFWPLHLGHDHMIEVAMKLFDEVTIVVSNHEVAKQRISEKLVRQRYQDATVVTVKDYDPANFKFDENGTCLDSAYMNYWANQIKSLNVDTIVSSDLYGKELAMLAGIEWLPIDPDRQVIPISATMIRSNPIKYWNYLTKESKVHFAKRIAVVGAESTGKSTVVKTLSDALSYVSGVPEWGRTISEHKKNLTYTDFRNIINIQNLMMDKAAEFSPIVLTDTEAVVTHLYADDYLETPDFLRMNIHFYADVRNNAIDQYVIMHPTVEWVDDGTRIQCDPGQRQYFDSIILSTLTNMGKPMISIDSNYHMTRTIQVSEIIQRMATEPFFTTS